MRLRVARKVAVRALFTPARYRRQTMLRAARRLDRRAPFLADMLRARVESGVTTEELFDNLPLPVDAHADAIPVMLEASLEALQRQAESMTEALRRMGEVASEVGAKIEAMTATGLTVDDVCETYWPKDKP